MAIIFLFNLMDFSQIMNVPKMSLFEGDEVARFPYKHMFILYYDFLFKNGENWKIESDTNLTFDSFY